LRRKGRRANLSLKLLQQFSLRVTKYLEKMERVSKIFENIQMPAAFTEELKAQTERLRETRTKFTEDIISPFKF